MPQTQQAPPSSSRKPPSRDPHSCPTCKKVFSRREYVRRHQKLKHMGDEPVRTQYTCTECSSAFPSSDQLEQHFQLFHPSLAPPSLVPEADPIPVVGSDAARTGSLKKRPLNPLTYEVEITRIENADPARITSMNDTPPKVHDEPEDELSFLIPTTASLPPVFLPDINSTPSSTTFILPTLGWSPSDSNNAAGLGNPEDLSHLSFFPSGIRELDLQLLIDSCQFPGQGGYVGEGRVRTSVPGKPGKSTDYYIRVRAAIGTPEDWAASERGIEALMAKAPPSLTSVSRTDQQAISTTFFNAAQPFCIGYKSQWDVPPLPRLSRYASLATAFLLNTIPVVHKPTMFDGSMTAQLAFALAVAGAGYEAGGRAFHDEMVGAKRHFAIYHLHELELTPEEDFSVLQSLTLYNFLGLFHQDLTQRQFSGPAHETLIGCFRRHNLLKLVQESKWVMPAFDATADQIERSWREWIRIETFKRLSFLIFLLDLELSNNFNSKGSLQPFELAIDLPAPALLWTAPSSRSWHALLHTPGVGVRPPSFLALLDAVLCLEWPEVLHQRPNSNSARLVPRLAETEPLALHVLVQTLVRLRSQLESQLAEEGAGAAPVDGRDPPEIALKRVQNGLALLEKSGARGGDLQSSWFSGVHQLFD